MFTSMFHAVYFLCLVLFIKVFKKAKNKTIYISLVFLCPFKKFWEIVIRIFDQRYADYTRFYKLHYSTWRLIKLFLTVSTCWFWYPRHEAHTKLHSSSLLFPLRALLQPLEKSAERTKSRRKNFRSPFPANDGAPAKGWTPLICPSPLSKLWLTALRGGKSLLVGVFAPVWTWGRERGGLRDDWERR